MEDKIKKAKAAGYSDEEISQFLGSQKSEKFTGGKKVLNQASELLNSVGLGVIPGAAASFYEIPGFAQRGGKARKVSEAQQDNPFLTGQKARSIQEGKNIEQPLREAAGAASWMIPTGAGGGAILPQIVRMAAQGGVRFAANKASQENTNFGDIAQAGATGAVVEPSIGMLLKAIPYLTKGGVAKKTQEAVTKATQEGKGDTYDAIVSQAEKQVRKKLGWTKDIEQAFNKTVLEKSPASLEPGGGVFTPEQSLDWRRQIGARQGSGIFQALQSGGDLQGKVDSIIRNVISSNLHTNVPATKIPDALYTLYNKGGPLFRGDVPTKIAKMGAAALVGPQIPYILRNILSGGIREIP